MLSFRGLRQRMAHFADRVVSNNEDLLPKVIGRWNWQAPPWIHWVGQKGAQCHRYLTADPKRALTAAISST